jgi:hypothetical protein
VRHDHLRVVELAAVLHPHHAQRRVDAAAVLTNQPLRVEIAVSRLTSPVQPSRFFRNVLQERFHLISDAIVTARLTTSSSSSR